MPAYELMLYGYCKYLSAKSWRFLPYLRTLVSHTDIRMRIILFTYFL